MNGTTTWLVPEMRNSTDTNITALERQRACFKWQHHQQQHQQVQVQEQEIIGYSNYLGELCGGGGAGGGGLLAEVVTRSVKPDTGLIGNGWPDLVGCFGSGGATSGACGYGTSNYMGEGSFSDQNNNGLGIEFNYAISRTSSCPPGPAVTAGVAEKMASVIGVGAGRESSKKRKANKVVAEEGSRDKRSKGCGEEGESKNTEKCSNHKNGTTSNNNKNNTTNKKGSNSNNNENSAETSKDNNSKVTEVKKPDYIHVRARRGQATDSHSLAERVRREKISERMKYLQELVPGCNKITGKAGMLDEIINYVQSLQRQVEFLSMKLAAVNPRLDFNIDNLFAKEAFPAWSTNFPAIGMSSDMTNSAYLQFNQSQQQIVACCGLEMGINPPDLGLRRTISASVSIPETFIDSSCFNQIQSTATCDADLQNLYNLAFDQGRTTSLPCQPFTGPIDAGNLKMEM